MPSQAPLGGWEQATKWLSQHGGTALFSRHVAVDSNEDVMHLWECQHAVKALSAPLPYSQPWISADFVGILSSIAENSILTVCQGQVNLLETMSPPCQPWSKAGKRQGLSCENGWAFISGLTHAFKLQACIVTAECADEIIHHHHFETLQHVAKLLGYRLVWSQVTPLHHISPMMRTRWLATWIRVDISAKYYDAKVNPHVLPRHRWFDPDFDFQIPPIWAEQLLLSESEKSFYGDVRFLPPAKKGALSSSSATAYQVLCPKEILYAFMLVGATQTMHLSRTAREARNIQDKWTLVIQGITCGELDFQSQKEQVWISPTLELQEPPKPPTVFVAVLQADFDTTIKALLDLGIWSAFEQLSLMWSPYQWNFVLCIPDLGISLACTADPYRRNLLCAAIQSLASVSTDFCGQPGLSDDVLVLSVTPRTIVADALAQNTLFIMTANSPCLWACKMGPSQDASTVFVVGGAIHNITQIAGQCTTPPLQPLNHGMLLHTAPCSIKAGGHHLRHGNPPTLPAHATFTQRAEFATNTHGWMAADEMAYVTQLLQWSTTAGPQYSPPVYWDITQSEFEESPFGPMAIQDHGTTYVPILVPQHLHTRIIMILARFLDIAPHRMTIIHHSSNWTPHLCGWELVYRWAGDHQVQNTLATTDTHNPMSENYRDMIDIVLQSAVEDWNEAGAQDGLAQFAFRLRRNFFLALSRRTLNSGQIANQRTLHTAYPPGYRPPIQVPHQDTPDEDQIQLRINTRLLHIQLNVSWMHSDEIDFILEGPRSLIPDTLFCPPATWISNIETLHFLAAPTPVYEPYRHILWIIETEQHWFQAECYKMQHQATLYITAPAASFEALQPLIQQLRTELGYNEANFVAHTMQQYHPAGMCGHQLVFNIYNRLGIQLPTLAVQQYGELQEGKHSAPIGYITQQAVARWHGANDFTGPHEITVDDPLTGTAYKRFALLHVAVGKATYQLATPKLKMTTSAITELVIEADSKELLELSGRTFMLTRDFIDHK
ncbi:unnamed protein product [Durusdinium trenchii]|uniref:Uncharacterized protein n=1 Tax=Durusdinium trenchii TaxID=1381693 RepID=A0ABP0IJV9_9DINO